MEVIAYIAADRRKGDVDMKEAELVEGMQIAEVVEVVGDLSVPGAVVVAVAASTAVQKAVEVEGVAEESTSEASLAESVFPPSTHFGEFEMATLPQDWRASSSAGSRRNNLHLNIDIGVAGTAPVSNMMVAVVLVADQMAFQQLCSREDVDLGNAWHWRVSG